jgi:hypothetical protein
MIDLRPAALNSIIRAWNRAGITLYVPVTGHSMRPLLRPGDVLVVQPGPAACRPGDLIVFWQQGRLVAHRLLRLEQPGGDAHFITGGDNALAADPPVAPADVLGRVTARQRGGRTLTLNTPFWRGLGRLVALSHPWPGPSRRFRPRLLRLIVSMALMGSRR